MINKKKVQRLLLTILFISMILFFSGCVQTKGDTTPIVLISPANNGDFKGEIIFTLKWEALVTEMDIPASETPVVEYYRVYYAMAEQFYREPKIVYPSLTPFQDNSEDPPLLEYKTPVLSTSTLYKWKVEAVLSNGLVLKSPEWKFKTGYLLQTGLSDMVYVQGGSFMMGDETGELGEFGDLGEFNRPAHKVTLTYDFFMAKYETTYAEYDRYCADTGIEKPFSAFGRGSLPVTYVTWNEAIAYCNWLSEREGYPKAYDIEGRLLDYNGEETDDITKVFGYRLPTEAEWEYAARGGPIQEEHSFLYAGSNDPAEVANSCSQEPIEVGQLKSNGLGLYDMSGNVYEWCHDHEHDYGSEDVVNPGPYYMDNDMMRDFKILRGGSYFVDFPSLCRVDNRRSIGRCYEALTIGFRIVKTGD